MAGPLATNAYSELRKAGFFSGTHLSDDQVVNRVIAFFKGMDDEQMSRAHALKAAEIIRDMLFKLPRDLG